MLLWGTQEGPPQQRVTWPKMSTVLRLTNPALEPDSLGSNPIPIAISCMNLDETLNFLCLSFFIWKTGTTAVPSLWGSCKDGMN